MDRIILVSCVVFLLIATYFEEALTTSHYDSSLDTSKNKIYDGTKISPAWFSPRLGRRKRNLKEDGYKLSDQELAEFLESVLGESPSIVTYSGNDKIVCKNVQGKRNLNFIPRLGRNLDEELSSNERWLQDPDADEYISQRSPPFAPRLGKRNLPYIPRLGREA